MSNFQHIHENGDPSEAVDYIVQRLKETILEVVEATIDTAGHSPNPNQRMEEITITAMQRLGVKLQIVVPSEVNDYAAAMIVSGIAAMICNQLHLRVVPANPNDPSVN